MGVNSKLFTATDAITHEPFTMLVEAIDPIGGEPFVVIRPSRESTEPENRSRTPANTVSRDWRRAAAIIVR